MAGQKFDVLQPLLRDGKRYGPSEPKGKTITLEDPDEIEDLARLGVINAPPADAPSDDQGGAGTKE